jgi:hypothetical protein
MNDTGIKIPNSTFYVRWSCRRCGHVGGFAQTTIPIVTKDWNEEMMRHLLDALREKLVLVHARGQGCIAAHDDFILERGVPEDQQISGLV